MDSQRITESSQHVTRGGSALSQVLSAALCDVYAHRDDYELSEYSENGFMVVVAEICAWQSGLPRSRGRSGYGWEYPHYVPCDVLICGGLRHLKIVRSFIEELYKFAEVHIASDEDPTAAVEPHVRAWFERAIDDWLEGLADDGLTHVLPGARPCP